MQTAWRSRRGPPLRSRRQGEEQAPPGEPPGIGAWLRGSTGRGVVVRGYKKVISHAASASCSVPLKTNISLTVVASRG